MHLTASTGMSTLYIAGVIGFERKLLPELEHGSFNVRSSESNSPDREAQSSPVQIHMIANVNRFVVSFAMYLLASPRMLAAYNIRHCVSAVIAVNSTGIRLAELILKPVCR
jgi:hypothetical protein